MPTMSQEGRVPVVCVLVLKQFSDPGALNTNVRCGLRGTHFEVGHGEGLSNG